MKIGCCLPGASFMPEGISQNNTNIDVLVNGYKYVKSIGYDYIECGLGMIMNLSEEEIQTLIDLRKKGEFCIEACNSFVPPVYKVSDASQLTQLTDYVEEAMRRMNLLGVSIIVFGSGQARSIPQIDIPKEVGAIEAFLKMCDEKAEKNNLIVTIEPLNRDECNLLNSVEEASKLIRKLNLSHIQLLADCFHMYKEDEDLNHLVEHADLLKHTHIAEPPRRVYPGCDGGEYIKEFAHYLKKSNYHGRVTIECSFDDFEKDINFAYSFMKTTFQ